jgi:RNA polymerase sigma-70 factor (ECF subfamily)
MALHEQAFLQKPVAARRRTCLVPPGQERPCLCPDHFDRVISENVDGMLAVARRVLGSEDLAWDAVQDALLSLWHERRMPPNPRAWLRRTVMNRSLHLARTHWRRRKHEERCSACRREGSRRDDPSRQLEDEDFWRCLEKALGALGHELRAVFLLREVEELDYGAIAERLGIPLGTVRSRLSRSRAALREFFGQTPDN